MQTPLIVDAHEDIAYNMLSFGRDYTRSAAETRRVEEDTGSQAPEYTGQSLLGWPEYQRGRVAVVFSTLFATPARRKTDPGESQAYADYNQAHRVYRTQLDTYRELADRHPEQFQFITRRAHLESVLADWSDASRENHPVGLVALMEGAEGVRNPSELDEWWEAGLRMIGLAWAGTRFCGGTRDPGPLTDDGRALLAAMAEFGFTLDLSHMDVLSALQSLDFYEGPIIASHANAAALLPGYDGNRLLPDEIIRGLIAHIDYICQMAGDARHVGLGSDFDGGFGLGAVPFEIDTIADLQKLVPILKGKGYNDEAVAAVLGENWLRHLRTTLPT
jgi:membrane dipeptidase